MSAGPLVVVALGGNAVSPPAGDSALAAERTAVARAADDLALLAAGGRRLLVVHGNGPQVGRLLVVAGADGTADLDVHVAQTQGELGYLLAEALEARLGGGACAALVTRVTVDATDPAFAVPTKPIGRVLPAAPAGVPAVRLPDGRGWRRVVASPRPREVIELDAIRVLLASRHVVAGGGGGVPLMAADGRRGPAPAVVDKDWVAALLAVELGAARLVFVTDVSHAYDDFGGAARPIAVMSVAEARARCARGVFAAGSMAPKVESAVEFVAACGRPARITTVGAAGAGTTIVP
ncbi:MAG: carbamate kinase [Candidatus Binatia bacterium]